MLSGVLVINRRSGLPWTTEDVICTAQTCVFAVFHAVLVLLSSKGVGYEKIGDWSSGIIADCAVETGLQ